MPHVSCRSWRLLAALFIVCALPAPGLAQERQPASLRVPTIAAAVAAAADWASTYHALSNYQVREVNPLLRPWQDTPGKLVVAGAVMDGVAFGAWNMTMGKRHPRIAAVGMWAMAGFRTYLAIHNVRNTRRAAKR
jgi:hypothetical protein